MIAETVANVILNILFVRLWGVTGIIAATIVSILLINFIGGENPYSGVIWGAIAALVGIAIAFAVTFILYKDEEGK